MQWLIALGFHRLQQLPDIAETRTIMSINFFIICFLLLLTLFIGGIMQNS